MSHMYFLGVLFFTFIVGYDWSSYSIMKKIDSQYKKRNLLFVGYNTFNVWRSYRKYKNEK